MKLNPFRGIPNKLEVWAWGMYDLANQSFTLLIVTLFFAIYFQKTIVPDPSRGEFLWGLSVSISSAIVVVLAPILGAISDFSGKKKLFLVWLGVGCSLATMLLGLTGPGTVAFAMIVFIVGNVLFMSGENFLAAFLPEISTRETIGKISSIGWTMGYAGALLCLPLALLFPSVRATPADFRPVFVFAGLWFLINALPTFFLVRERKRPEPLPPGQTLLTIGFRRTYDTLRHVGRFRDLALFLSFFIVYCFGMTVIISFAGIIASRYLPRAEHLVFFAWMLAGVSGVASFTTGFYQDRLGHKITVMLSLVIWIATSLGAAALPPANANMLHFWLVGIGVGFGLGMTGTASRALVGALTPAHRTAEFFGFWGQGYKIAGALGPFAYATISSSYGPPAAMTCVAGTFIVGLIGVMFVNIDRGRAAAEHAEREFAGRACPADLAAAGAIGVVGRTALGSAKPDRDLESVARAAGEGRPSAETPPAGVRGPQA